MKLRVFLSAFVAVLMLSCGSDGKKNQGGETEQKQVTEVDPLKDKGIGPIKSIELGPVDDALVAKGEAEFKLKCSACHKVSKRFIGPAMAGVVDRRTPEWIMNMILNPEEMVAKNPTAKKLFAEYLSPMANQNLTEEEARSILEYFRTLTPQ